MSNFKTLFIPMIGIVIGALLGLFLTPSPAMLLYLRNLAAGVVLAAASIELLPKVANVNTTQGRIFVVLGFVVAAVFLIFVRFFFGGARSSNLDNSETISFPWDAIFAMVLDFIVIAFLIGISSHLGPGVSLVLGLSLGVQMILLTLTLSRVMKAFNISHGKIVLILISITLAVLAFTLLGYILGQKIQGKPLYYAMLAFGTVSLLWLVTEEFLVVAPTTKFNFIIASSLIFIGFLIVIILRWLVPDRSVVDSSGVVDACGVVSNVGEVLEANKN